MVSSQTGSFDKGTKLGLLLGVGARYLFAHILLLKSVDYILSTLNRSMCIGAFFKFRDIWYSRGFPLSYVSVLSPLVGLVFSTSATPIASILSHAFIKSNIAS